MYLSSRERILRTLRGEKVDRIPLSLYEFDGFYDDWIHKYPEYRYILDYARGKTDKMYFWEPSCNADAYVLHYGKIPRDNITVTAWNENASRFTKTEINTPRGQLTTTTRQDEGIHCAWTIEHLCKNEEDFDKLASIPYEPFLPPVDSFFTLDKKLGDTGIVLGSIADSLCLAVDLFGCTPFLTLLIDNKKLVLRMLDFIHERVYGYLEHLLANGAISLYRIVGAEYATPPFMPPNLFDELVVKYEKELIDLLHKYGALARIHCHGKIKKVLPRFKEMKIDAIDPVEPPPDGDITITEARRITADEITLMGNFEERLFEIGSKETIENEIQKTIAEGRGGRFILCPTAMPLTTPLDKKIQDNIIHYIDCGLKYGTINM